MKKIVLLCIALVGSFYSLLVLNNSHISLSEQAPSIMECKDEELLKLSLFHIQAVAHKLQLDCLPLHTVCNCIKKRSINEISQFDMRNMTLWLLDVIKKPKKNNIDTNDQLLHASVSEFLCDCVELNLKNNVAKGVLVTPCLSELVINSLEECEAEIIGDLIVAGQIIHPFCEDLIGPAGLVGPVWPVALVDPIGPTGLGGSAGSPGQNLDVSEGYLFASLDDGTRAVLLTTGEETSVDLSLISGLTDTAAWTSAVGSEGVTFVLSAVGPDSSDGIYQVSYELRLQVDGGTSENVYAMDAWVERVFSLSEPVGELAFSRFRVSQDSSSPLLNGLGFLTAEKLISNTFLVKLVDGDVIQLRIENTADSLGTGANLVPADISLPVNDGLLANLVIIKVDDL